MLSIHQHNRTIVKHFFQRETAITEPAYILYHKACNSPIGLISDRPLKMDTKATHKFLDKRMDN